ncbi:DUF3078 domain-containing protein [Psychroflexus salis]|uniref:DUF3078 domain-containing protein n=1 Tax=Psychroflexus salis TaxID=1526574 RepID=UPI00166CA0F4|nr:DUF3078 domain-containing protein [Psychroflexus salis]
MKKIIFFFFICLVFSKANSQRNPLFFKERPLNVFIKKSGPIEFVKDYTDRDYKIENATLLIPNQAPESFWKKINRFSFDFTQVSFANWNAGGISSIAGLSDFRFRRTYEKGFVRWNNEMIIRYGLNKQENQNWRKTDDDFEMVSTFGYKFSKSSKWFYTARSSFKTQLTPGYNYPNRDESISQIMAPGYFFLGIGAEFSEPEKELIFYASPLTQKTTFVLNQRLANQGAFGVREAQLDNQGNLVRKGSKIRNETGILIKNEFRKEVLNDVILFSRISLFTDYFKNFGNIDVDWELIVDLKVNEYIKARIGSHIRYDDDIRTTSTDQDALERDEGPKIQWKQQIGVGILIEL